MPHAYNHSGRFKSNLKLKCHEYSGIKSEIKLRVRVFNVNESRLPNEWDPKDCYHYCIIF